jgi:hypothetical protein
MAFVEACEKEQPGTRQVNKDMSREILKILGELFCTNIFISQQSPKVSKAGKSG